MVARLSTVERAGSQCGVYGAFQCLPYLWNVTGGSRIFVTFSWIFIFLLFFIIIIIIIIIIIVPFGNSGVSIKRCPRWTLQRDRQRGLLQFGCNLQYVSTFWCGTLIDCLICETAESFSCCLTVVFFVVTKTLTHRWIWIFTTSRLTVGVM